jgi:hypothetical protein|tara:strand:+ start:764 stop:1084 length:321 start_codon:yes stop_codon:yes gene_type:complete
MNIDNAIDDIVLLVQREGQPLKGLGIRNKQIYVCLKGYDSIGLWVELLDYNLPQLAHSESGPQNEITTDACALIPWTSIETVVHFPNLEGFDFPKPEVDQLGFQNE